MSVTNVDNKQLIPLKDDFLFKKVFGEDEGIERLEGFLSMYFHVPINEIKGKVKILNGDFRKEKPFSKDQKVDVKANVELGIGELMINIEVNAEEGTTLERNILYASRILSNQLTKKKINYKKLKPLIQINFDKYEINEQNKRIIKRCYIKDETNKVISDLLEFVHINIAKCHTAWYNKTIDKEKKEDQDLIRFGALLLIDNSNDFKTCMEEIDMSKEIKEDIEDTVEWYADDEIMLALHDRESIIEDARQQAEERGHDAGFKKGHEEGHEEGRKEGRKEGIKQGIKQGLEQKSIEITKNLLEQNIDINIISSSTGLSIEEIEGLK